MKKPIKNGIKVVFSSGLLIGAASALAEPYGADDDGIFIKGQYGLYQASGSDEFEDENDLIEGAVGWRLNPFMSIQGSYIYFGEYGGDFASATVSGYTLSAAGHLPLGDKLDVFIRLGQLFSTVDVEVAEWNDEFDENSLFLGLGLNYEFTDGMFFSVEYDRFKVDYDTDNFADDLDFEESETDFNVVKAGVKIQF